jgi:hypothetical protein
MDAEKFLERPASMSNDIRDILQRLTAVESRLTPVGVKSGLNRQQKSVPQLPALFKPHGIKALGSKTDPQHPMAGYMVGDSVEPRKTALEEAMAEIEEDMLSKVKKDLTTYLDRLEKKVRVDRDLKDKAQDAVQKGQAEEEIEEIADTDPAAMSGPSDPGDTEVAHNIELGVADKLNAPQKPQAPQATFEMDDGSCLECWGDDANGYEIKHGKKTLPSRFKSMDDAGMAVKLYKARRQRQQRPEQDLSQDYIEER